jgi:hypothetical protein
MAIVGEQMCTVDQIAVDLWYLAKGKIGKVVMSCSSTSEPRIGLDKSDQSRFPIARVEVLRMHRVTLKHVTTVYTIAACCTTFCCSC